MESPAPLAMRKAISAGDDSAARALLQGRPVNTMSIAGESLPVWAAANAPEASLVGLLGLFQEAGWVLSPAQNVRILDELVRWERTIALETYVRRYAPSLDTRDALGDAPLHVAAQTLRVRSFRMLVAQGASLKTKDGNDRTPLAALVNSLVDSLDYLGSTLECTDVLDFILELRTRHRAPLGCEGLPLFARLVSNRPTSALGRWAAHRAATKAAWWMSRALPSGEGAGRAGRL